MSGASSSSVATAAAAVTSAGELGLRPGPPVDRRLRRAAARRHRADEAARGVAEPGGDELPVRREARLAGRGERAPHGDGLGEAHQRDAGGGGPHLPDQVEPRPAPAPAARAALRRWWRRRPRAGRAPRRRRSRRRSRPAAAPPTARSAPARVSARGRKARPPRWRAEASGRCAAIATMSRKNPVFSMCTPRSLGAWSSTITRPIPALKPVSTESEMKLPMKPRRSARRGEQDGAHQHGERPRRRDQLRRAAAGRHPAELGAGEDRDGRGGADAQAAASCRATRRPPSARSPCTARPAPAGRRWWRRPSPWGRPPPPRSGRRPHRLSAIPGS